MSEAGKQQLDFYRATSEEQGVVARHIAVELIGLVLRHKRTLDDLFESHVGVQKLESRDRGFVRLLVATVLRRLGQLDDLADRVVDRPLDRITPRKALDIIRLGIAQIVFLETPAHAAVDTSVRLSVRMGMDKQKGLINAVLRNFLRQQDDLLTGQDGARLNTPDWMWFSWVKQFGVETTLDIANANLNEASLDITVKQDVDGWSQKLEAQILPTGTLRRPAGGAIDQLPGYKDGAWWVQDAAAALPARLFGDVTGKIVVDLCAAPGGKSAQLAQAGASVIALDRAARRMARLQENVERLGLCVQGEVADATVWQPLALVDAVLLDAPCSATGTIRRHPDILHLKTPGDIDNLVQIQERLLNNAVGMLKPGGLLIYCTCSLQFQEGEQQIDRLLKSGAPLRRVPVEAGELGGVQEIINARGEVRALPHHLGPQGGLDGFFIARLEKVA